MVDRGALLALYDAEMRRAPIPEPGTRVEQVGTIVRVVGTENYVLFSDLTEVDARDVVASQADFFRAARAKAEWKVFGHDRPKDLPEILAAQGFVPDEPETLVVFDLGNESLGGTSTPGVEIRPVTDEAQLRDALQANEAAFGPDTHGFIDRYRDRLADPTMVLFVAYVDGHPARDATRSLLRRTLGRRHLSPVPPPRDLSKPCCGPCGPRPATGILLPYRGCGGDESTDPGAARIRSIDHDSRMDPPSAADPSVLIDRRESK